MTGDRCGYELRRTPSPHAAFSVREPRARTAFAAPQLTLTVTATLSVKYRRFAATALMAAIGSRVASDLRRYLEHLRLARQLSKMFALVFRFLASAAKCA